MLSGKKLILLGLVVVLLAAIPLTLYFVSQQQEVRSRATAATILSFDPASDTTNPISKNVGDQFKIDILMDPGTNAVTYAKLNIIYDPTKLATASPGIQAISGVSSIANKEGAVYGIGSVTIPLGVIINPTLADPTKTIRTPTKIASITFKAIVPTTNQATSITFGNKTIVYAGNETGDPNAPYPANLNVLSTTKPAFIAIAASTISPTPTPTGPISTPTPTSGATGTNQVPVCSALNVDRTATGIAPFSIAFTVNGTDSDGTISSVTFDFGDGPLQTVNQNGGIGTKTASVQVAHTYNNAGTYKASATLTDNNGGVSLASTSCTQTVTVNSSSGSVSGTPTPSIATPSPTLIAVITSTPTPIPFNSPTPTIAKPGPQNQIVGIGAVATVLSIVGALLFFAL